LRKVKKRSKGSEVSERNEARLDVEVFGKVEGERTRDVFESSLSLIEEETVVLSNLL